MIYTDPDAKSQHALSSQHAVNIGDPSAYLDGQKIIDVARENGCLGIHPGYGFVGFKLCKYSIDSKPVDS